MSGSTLPTVMTAAGLQPLTAAYLRQQIVSLATALSPGLTTDLPASLIEDQTSTGTGALLVCDQARDDLINSVTPLGANPFILYQLGQIYGVAQGQGINSSVYVVFEGTPGYVIPTGFTVSDGSNQYTVSSPGGAIATNGYSQPLLAVAINSGSFAISAGSVNQLITSVPSAYTLTVTNPNAGIPATSAQTISDYRAQVLQAGYVTSTGCIPLLKTLLSNVPGVNQNLISVEVVVGVGWEVIVGGGGDEYLVAYAIYTAIPDFSRLVGSTISVTGITAAANGVVTTNLNHGYSTGQAVTISGVSPSGYNQTYSSVTVLTPTTFQTNVNTSGYGSYVSGGVCTPNFRNVTVSIYDFPNTYEIPYVISPAQSVTMSVSWNTVSVNYVSPTTVAALAAAALSNYINGLGIGQPINIDVMVSVFQTAVASLLPASLISVLNFGVNINGVTTSPLSGTTLIYGDPESYFQTSSASIVVTQA